jgi:hypothetical protein
LTSSADGSGRASRRRPALLQLHISGLPAATTTSIQLCIGQHRTASTHHVKPKAQPAVFGVHARQLEVDRRTKRTAKSRVVMLVPWRACTPDDALRLRRSGSEALAGA